jgi:hypothetical protein
MIDSPSQSFRMAIRAAVFFPRNHQVLLLVALPRLKADHLGCSVLGMGNGRVQISPSGGPGS